MNHLLGIRREYEMDFMIAAPEIMQKSLEIDRSAGSGGGKDKSNFP